MHCSRHAEEDVPDSWPNLRTAQICPICIIGAGSDEIGEAVHIGREDQRSFDTGLAYAVSRRFGRSVGAWDPA
jgi:hypothetical protein